jgi:hypothetical protein
MIRQYNLRELLAAGLCGLGSLAGYVAAFYFFRFAFRFVGGQFRVPALVAWSMELSALVLVLITIGGYFTWRSRNGFSRFDESGMSNLVDPTVSGGAYELDRAARRVTGPAWLLSQLFLAGPLFALRAHAHLLHRVPDDPQHEARLQQTLETLRRANQWQSLSQYPDAQAEILLLARMGILDYSPAKGRFKART